MKKYYPIRIYQLILSKTIVPILTIVFVFTALLANPTTLLDNKVHAVTTDITATSCFINDISNSACLTAITVDGTTSTSFTKNAHVDAAFETLSVGTVNSATLYYDSWATLSGSWEIHVKDARDGTTICSIDPAPEDASETTNSLSCSLTPTQLSNGVWLYALNNDTAGPQSVNFDYIRITVDYNPVISISLSTDGSVSFGTITAGQTVDTTSSGLNDPETVSVDAGPVDLDIKTTTFSDGSNTWTLGSSAGTNQVKYEFSKDGSAWTTFLIADSLYTFDTNVAQSATRNIYLKLTVPSTTSSYNQHSSTVTIVCSQP